MRLHRNVSSSLDRLEKFIFTEWEFEATNTGQLQEWLNEKDKVDYNVEIKQLQWDNYFEDLSKGTRIYLNKEPMKNIEAARGKDTLYDSNLEFNTCSNFSRVSFRLMALHLLLQLAIFSTLWYLFACIFGASMSKTAFIVPVFYILFSFL